jgi:hypothetical protein
MFGSNQLSAISRAELDEVIGWFSNESTIIPDPIRTHLERMITVYSNMGYGKGRANQALTQLRQAMGIEPKSERGRSQTSSEQDNAPLPLGPEYEEIRNKRNELIRQTREYDRRLDKLTRRHPPAQAELDLERPSEILFSSPVTERCENDKRKQVERMQEFNKGQGLHVAYDYPKRLDFKCVVTEITYQVETVTDPETGKSVRASMLDEGPEGFSLTWGAVSNLIKMHVGFAIPIHRMVGMIGQPEFSSSKICRVLQYVALNLVGIYLALSDQLSDVQFLSGDDTSTKVLVPESEENDPICKEIDDQLIWNHMRADGKGEKKALNVSLIKGKTDKDPRSTIRFFRTHFGSVGNLLTKILESRNPKSGPVIFQGDLSSANLPSPEIQTKTGLLLAGCGAHARRPFWRYRNDDQSLCYFMLRGFLTLSEIESKIDERGRTRENVLKLRTRYGRLVWLAMKNRCQLAVTGYIRGMATYPRGITPNVWPKGTELHRAAMYIINHFDELTLYLKHPELEYTNNGSERAVRIEKCMLSSSKFRKTKRGRVTLDILRTINATCTAAGVDLTDYLIFVFTHPNELHDSPECLTPFAFAKLRDQKNPAPTANVTSNTMPSY